MPKPASSSTSLRPMPPKPITPSVRSRSSRPMNSLRSLHRASRTRRSLVRTLCASAIIQPSVASATGRSTAPTVVTSATSAAVHASTSTES